MVNSGGNGGAISYLAVTIPVVLAAGLGGIGYLVKSAITGINHKFDKLEASFSRVTGDLAAQHARLDSRVDAHDRRITRIESWKELVTLPDPYGRNRRGIDRLLSEEEREA